MSVPDPRILLDIAIDQENWELAALCIVVMAIETVQSLPPDAAESMLDELAVEGPRPRHRPRGRRHERRHQG